MTHSKSNLFKPLKVGDMQLQHRVVMAPLTRFRADAEHVHHEHAEEYYEQRACRPGTLLITEATFISPGAGGYANVPGIHKEAQIQAWKKIVNRVHNKKSFIYLQLWALGRAASPNTLTAEGNYPFVAPSAIGMDEGGVQPRPLTIEEIQTYIKDYAQAAANFVHKAGGDGVELHGANGYLVDQFLETNSNQRTDKYGGSVENRIRFALEIIDAICEAVTPQKTGIRISPYSTFQGMKMSPDDIKSTFGSFVKELKKRQPDLAYLHVVESRIAGASDAEPADQSETINFIEEVWAPRPIFIAGGFKRQTAIATADKYEHGAIVFGRYFISNPDLVDRLENDYPLEPYNRDTFYLRGPDQTKGYTDYPSYTVPSKLALL